MDLRFLGLSGWLRLAQQWINFIWDEINSFQNFGIFEILDFSKFWDLRFARILGFEIFAPKLLV